MNQFQTFLFIYVVVWSMALIIIPIIYAPKGGTRRVTRSAPSPPPETPRPKPPGWKIERKDPTKPDKSLRRVIKERK